MADLCDIVESTAAGIGEAPTGVVQGVVLNETLTGADVLIQSTGILLVSTMQAVSAAIESTGILLVSRATASSMAFGIGRVADMVTSKGVARDRLLPLVIDHVDDHGVGQSIYLPMPVFQRIVDAAVASTMAIQHASLSTFVTSKGVLRDRLTSVMGELIEETLTGTGAATGQLMAIEQVASAAVATAIALGMVHLTDLVVDDSGTGTALVLDRLLAIDHLAEELRACGVLILPGSGEAWTANTDTLGMSHYQHMPVNSVAALGDRLFVATDDGLFIRDGTDDDGARIDGYVRTGLHRWGTSSLFRPQEVYAGYQGGPMRVTIGETSVGVERSWSYDMPARSIDPSVPTHGRVTPGQGMRTMYARVTIGNIDGKPLMLTDAEMTTYETSRKT